MRSYPLRPLYIFFVCSAALLAIAAIITLGNPDWVFGFVGVIIACFICMPWHGSGQHHKTLVLANDLVERELINADLVIRGAFTLDMAVIDKGRKVIVTNGDVYPIEQNSRAFYTSMRSMMR